MIDFDFNLIFTAFAFSIILTTVGSILGFINLLKKQKKKLTKFTKITRTSIILGFVSIIILLSEIYNNFPSDVDKIVLILTCIFLIPIILLIIFRKKDKIIKIIYNIMTIILLLYVLLISVGVLFLN